MTLDKIFDKEHIGTIREEAAPFIWGTLLIITDLINTHFLVLFGVLYLGANRKVLKKGKIRPIMVIIVVLSSLNQVLFSLLGNSPQEDAVIRIVPYSILIMFTMYLVDTLDERIFKWVIFWIIIEIVIGCLEYVTGVTSIIGRSDVEKSLETDVLYNRSVYGFGTNSSGFAFKIIFAFLLYQWREINRFIKPVFFYCIITVGLIISFNRTCIIGFIVYHILAAFNNKKILLVYVTIIICVYVSPYWEIISFQFTRGGSANPLSNRDIIFPYYWNFFKEHFMCGNGSFKFYWDSGHGLLHAHNSFLQTLATNGVLISSLYFGFIIKNINRGNYLYIIPILVMSCTQTLILWGISFMDIIFYSFLFSKEKSQQLGNASFASNSGGVIHIREAG